MQLPTTDDSTLISGPGISRRPDVLLYFALELVFDGALAYLAWSNPELLKLLTASPYPLLQWLIFGAFAIGVMLSYGNFIRLAREERILFRALSLVGRGQDLADGVSDLPTSSVKERLMGLLLQPSKAKEGDPVGRDALEAQESIRAGWGRYLSGVLTMMGLLGTFLGLMIAIESMRDLLALKDFEAFFSGVVGALDGMGTAFSTSLAGICGAVILGFQQLLVHHAQLAYLGRLDLMVSRHVAPRLQEAEGVGGLEVELHRMRQAFSQWRVDVSSAGIEMQGAAEALAEHTLDLAQSSQAVLAILDERQSDWRRFETSLHELQQLAEQENRMLLDMVRHRVGGLDDLPEPEPAIQGGQADGDGSQLSYKELRRMNELLASIHREMSLSLRMSANKLEQNQGELSRLVQRLLKRSDATASNATHQILLLRNLIQYLGQDETRLQRILEQATNAVEQGE